MAKRFNDEWIKAFKTGIYWCPMCIATPMHFEDEHEDVLVCDECGYSMPAENYGYTQEELDDIEQNGYEDDGDYSGDIDDFDDEDEYDD